MPWRLIGIILLCGIFLVFIGFNLENSCNISFGFTVVQNVPVYLTAFTAFVLGMLCAIPFAVAQRRKKQPRESAKAKTIDSPKTDTLESLNISKEDKKKQGRKKKDDSIKVTELDDGSYGID
ncbi:hypothetical protein [Breznakiella homolactica]|uniref:Lipopolysaccharide assembly protein A domain-containing protein n=1 Tax=Breznakiella homolactica TaxID=2798577 RepID=A0A7T7XJF5_9SPIR|nr:hypothetical protein [Breznakiella homolactica]QQO07544.1 hypothetical protein JFL75_11350 [Breznakiella homolactica]